MRTAKLYIIVSCSVLLTACSEEQKANVTKKGSADSAQAVSSAGVSDTLSRGRQLYLQNCAVCHGMNAEGAPNWRQRDAEGKFPPPPLNGTAHTWHHPKQALIYTIKNGTAQLGGNMPAWKDKLSDQDIEHIIAWIQSLWPEEIYAAWQRLDTEARQGK